MNYQIDNFPFDVTASEHEEWQVIINSNPGWGGPITPETEAAKIAGLKAAWVNADARRAKASARMTAARPTMRQVAPHQNGMSEEHRVNLSKAAIGNTNAKKPHKYPAKRKSTKVDTDGKVQHSSASRMDKTVYQSDAGSRLGN